MEGMAAAIFGDKMRTNSTHHQAVGDPGEMRIVARASDGVIEAVAATTGFALGVQWHPEQMGDCRPYQALIDATISQQTHREE
jgi:putative glutamine amidotransferase